MVLAGSCPQLRSLEHWAPECEKFCISEAQSASLGHLSQLTSLTLGLGLDATNVEIESILQGLPSLLHLGLHCHGRTKITDAILSGRALERVTIWDSNMKDLALALGELRSLTRLALHACGLRDLPDTISLLTGLREIDLLDDNRCNLPEGLAACTNLTSLVMAFGNGMSVLSELESLRSFSYMIGFTEVEKWALIELTGLTHLSMKMRFNKHFPELTGMPSLRKLVLSECGLSDLRSLRHILEPSDEPPHVRLHFHAWCASCAHKCTAAAKPTPAWSLFL